MLGCRIKVNRSLVGPRPAGGGALHKGHSKRSYSVFILISEKTMENFERLGRQARPGIESGTSRLPVLNAEPFDHWWGKTH